VKLENSQGRWRLDGLIVSTPKLVQKLEASEDNITCDVDHWFNHIIGGFVIEFMVVISVSYSEEEQFFSRVCEVST